MALPKIVFHNVTNGLTAEIILSEEIDKNAIIEIPSDDTASVTDGSGNKVIRLTTHEQMKRLLNQMTTEFNNISNTLRSSLTSKFQSIDSAIANEVQAREQGDQTLQNALNAETQARTNKDSQLQTNIDNEARARQSKDSDLQTQINEKVPVGTIIPVLKSLNGIKVETPDYVKNNYLKCDGSLIPDNSQYRDLINTLYPSFDEQSSTRKTLESFSTLYLNLYTWDNSSPHFTRTATSYTWQSMFNAELSSVNSSFSYSNSRFCIGFEDLIKITTKYGVSRLQDLILNFGAGYNAGYFHKFSSCTRLRISFYSLSEEFRCYNNDSYVGNYGSSSWGRNYLQVFYIYNKTDGTIKGFFLSNPTDSVVDTSTVRNRYSTYKSLHNFTSDMTLYEETFDSPKELILYKLDMLDTVSLYYNLTLSGSYPTYEEYLLRNVKFLTTGSSANISGSTTLKDYLNSLNVTDDCIMSLKDFNKLVKFDFIKMLSTYMLPIGHYISIRYRNSTHSFSVYGKGLNTYQNGMPCDVYVTIDDQDPLTDNGDDYKIDGVSGKDPTNILDNPFIMYIQFADLSREKVIKEEVFICFGRFRIPTGVSEEFLDKYPSHRIISKEGNGLSSFITSCNAMMGTGYLGVRCVPISLNEIIDPFLNNSVHGYINNLIEIYGSIGDFFTYVSGGNLINSSRLGRFSMGIGDFSRFVNIDESVLRNNFLANGENLTFNMWRFRQWLGVRGDGKIMGHNYNEYYPFNASTNPIFGNDTGGFDIGTQVRDGRVSLIRIYNCKTRTIEREMVYYSFDTGTDFDDCDYTKITANYPTFLFDDHPNEFSFMDSYDGSATERICYVYRLSMDYLFKNTKRYKDTFKYETIPIGQGLDQKLLNMYRIKYNYEATGGDTSITGIEYQPYGGVGRISMYGDDYKDFAGKLKTVTNSYGMKRFYIERIIEFTRTESFHSTQFWDNCSRYQVRVNNYSYIDLYAYNGSWTPSTSEYRSMSLSPNYIYVISFQYLAHDGTKATNTTNLVLDIRNNGSTTSVASSNSWCTGIIGRYYRNFKNPPYNGGDYVLIDQNLSPAAGLDMRVVRIHKDTGILYGYHCIEECSDEYPLPDLTNEDYVIGSGSAGQYINTGLILNKTYGDHDDPAKQNTPYHKNKILKILTVEFWIKF